MKEHNRKKHDSCRRQFLSECIHYGAALFMLGSIPALSSCSKQSDASAGTKVLQTTPSAVKTPLSGIDQKLVAVAKKGEPYDLTMRAVKALGGMEKFVAKGETVMLLPNMAWDRTPEMAANTHPDVVRAIVDMCKEAGAKEIGLFCHPCHPAQSTYKTSGVADVAEKAGAQIWYVEPGRDFTEIPVNGMNLQSTKVFNKLLASDRFISIPIAKVHSLSGYTMCMKNLMGAIEDRPALHPNINQDLADLSMVLKPDLNVLDATRILVKNGPTGGSTAFVETPQIVIAGANPVSVDSIGITLFNKTPDALKCLSIAQKLGRGEYDPSLLQVREA